MWAHTAGVQVGVAGRRVNSVLFKVFTDVLCGGLRQQTVKALPEEDKRSKWEILVTMIGVRTTSGVLENYIT